MCCPVSCYVTRELFAKLTAEIRLANESLLYSQREKVQIELDKIVKRIDEFSDYGELEMMRQYVDDVKSVQKRIAEAEKLIDWITNVSAAASQSC